jgi:biopolymer transport protein ExbD
MTMAHGTLSSDDEIISGINVTPLVDVVLVILIIFIMTASLIFRSEIPVKLPQAQSAESTPSGLLTVGINRSGQLYLNGKPGSLDDIPRAVATLKERSRRRKAPVRAFVSADIAARYGTFAQVVDRLRLEGVTDIALDTDPKPMRADPMEADR